MHHLVQIFLYFLFSTYLAFSQPVILVKHTDESEVMAIKRDAQHYIDQLNIGEDIHLTINFTRHIPHRVRGMVFCLNTIQPNGYHHIVMRIDSRLNSMQRTKILAHEMIHVKQYAKGELIDIGKGKLIWKGRKYKTRTYSKRTPWEVEAYQMQRLLVKGLLRKNKDHYTDLAVHP